MAAENLKKILHDFCPFCGKQGDYNISEDAVLYREAKCEHCGASLRNSDVAKEILKQFGNNKTVILADLLKEKSHLKILNTCSTGYLHEALKEHPGYTASEYYQDTVNGEKKGNIVCVDLCDIPFENNSFDLVISEDVFEHIKGYDKAFSEILRILKPNGHHIFTVPLHEGHNTVSRLGNPKKIYHGDPLNAEEGCLVITDFGDDIVQILEQYGGESHLNKAHIFYQPSEITNCDFSYEEYLSKKNCLETYFKYNSTVIDTRKSLDAPDVFTGERFVPGIDDVKLSMEHYQRYYSILPLVIGKKVLDAACGEGYGTALLAVSAARVTGIDISVDAVNRARQNYADRDNIDFIEGSIAHLPMADHSVDAVISFETIEHVTEEIQRQFLDEIQRVLKEDGFLIMSTPNKEIYSDRPKYHNEFHVKEFYRDEFLEFLHTRFSQVMLYDQFFENVCIIKGEKKIFQNAPYYCPEEYDQEAKYYVAVAGNGNISSLEILHIYMNPEHEYDSQLNRILQLQDEVETRNRHLHKLDGEIAEYRKYIDVLKEETEQKEHIEKELSQVEQHLREEEDKVASLYSENVALSKENEALKIINASELETNIRIKGELESLEAENIQLKDIERQRQATIENLRQIIQDKDEILAESLQMHQEEQRKVREEQERARQEYQCETQDLRQTILNKEGHIQLLLEVEREYEREKHSRTYRMALVFRRISTFFLPPNSRRRFLVKMLAKGIRHPKLMLRMVNPRRIRNFFTIVKKEGMDGVNEHYRLVEEYETSRLHACRTVPPEITQVEDATGRSIADYVPLSFIKYKNPEVSIVIPVYNQFEYTYNCLESILKNSDDIRYEVIVADDCSTDITRELEQAAKGIRIIRNKDNLRFLKNCNHAARQAKGKYILFLNNDTQVQPGWLTPLVKLIEKDEKIGMVGSKLIYPDGRLQEAGGIIWGDGHAWNYGHGQNPSQPEFNYVKEVDYISGAAIMIRADLWKEIGGFDEHFAPSYCEDSDLAFEVRRRGYKLVYQPQSVVVHFEGMSNGTDVHSGLKQYQVVNSEKLARKWAGEFKKQSQQETDLFHARDRSQGKKTILVIDHYVPMFDKDAGSRTIWQYINMFVEKGYNVKFMGDNFYPHEPYTTALQQIGVEVLYGPWYAENYRQWILDNKNNIDFAFLNRPHITEKYIDLLKEETDIKCIYYGCDLHCMRIRREYELCHDKKLLAEAEDWERREFSIMRKTDINYYPSSVEIEQIHKVDASIPAKTFDIYVYEKFRENIPMDFSKREGIMFVGGFGHPPNEDAVLWFVDKVFPLIRRRCDIPFYVIGANPTEQVKKLAGDRVVIKGFVTDDELEEMYDTCRMAVIPLRYGAGVKGKVIEALYYGIPMVTTSIGIEGITGAEQLVEIADTADSFADKVVALYNDMPRLNDTVQMYQDYVKEHCSVEAVWNHIKDDFAK